MMERLNDINRIVDKILNASVEFFQCKDSTKKVLLSSDCTSSNSVETKYLEILLKEELLNEKDIDLLTIEIGYKLKNGMIDVKGEFYGSDGIILNEFQRQGFKFDLEGIEKILFSFIEEIKNKYDDILKKYIRE